MEAVQRAILAALDASKTGRCSTDTLDAFRGLDANTLYGALNSLQQRSMVAYTVVETEQMALTPEGREVQLHGSQEARVFDALPAFEDHKSGEGASQGMSMAALAAAVGAETAKIGQGKAFKQQWIRKDAQNLLSRAVASIQDDAKVHLAWIMAGDTSQQKTIPAPVLNEYKKRKWTTTTKTISYDVTKGAAFSLDLKKEATDLTTEMLADGSWKTTSFKKYNYDALGAPIPHGALHPLLKVREEIRQTFLEMGFEEMPTNQFVESSFWNFDALFQPQQHPSRDAHDTFFLKDPATSDDLPMAYVERVKQVHSKGGFGSTGYGYDWQFADATKLLLRTHTTSISSAMLYKLANQPGGFRPAKYFSIDRVFRNETVDATHLAEFHQVEGVIADHDLSLGDLIGFMQIFFGRMGIGEIKVKPAYNPYTEPSMEIFGFHKGLNKWVEMGNSGMFRPEMLLPLGLPANARVIAWGLSLERPTMIKYAIDNIRELVGHKTSLSMIMDNAICRLETDVSIESPKEREAKAKAKAAAAAAAEKEDDAKKGSIIEEGLKKLKMAATAH